MSKKVKEMESAIAGVGHIIAGAQIDVTVHTDDESIEPDRALIEAIRISCVTTCVGVLDMIDGLKAGKLRAPADYANSIIASTIDTYIHHMIDEGDES